MSLFRQHMLREQARVAGAVTLVSADSSAAEGGDAGAERPVPASGTGAELALARLTTDRRALKQIQSLERKIERKREMIPEHMPWIEGLLSAADESGTGVQDEVLPTIMVWLIDTGDLAGALPLAAYVLRYNVALPGHFERQAATLIAEEVAEAALNRGVAAPVALLEEFEELVSGEDMPDEVKAKLTRAIGAAYDKAAADDDGESGVAGAKRAALNAVLERYTRALQLDPRAGVKKRRDQLAKQLAAPIEPPAEPPADTQQNSGEAG